MKTVNKTILACVAALAMFVSPSVVQADFLTNGGFENGDLTGWSSSDLTKVTVGAPVVGAQAGSFAASFNNPTADGVAELFQTFAASPGDEYNLQGYMLTESALPAGVTFGLLKIVFEDAMGNDLVPASVSKGQFGPAANPGVESLPFLNDASAVDTWIFSEAQGVAPTGTASVSFFALNVDFGNGFNHPMWFDSL